jgi:hypothetical protein|tara:strand:+ start:698 stop:844 length:147 start_codon:yes stop_codon:yes gene_type:complete
MWYLKRSTQFVIDTEEANDLHLAGRGDQGGIVDPAKKAHAMIGLGGRC